jgi:hypothetical protein
MNTLVHLTDDQLLEVFSDAANCYVEEEFLELLRKELKRRGIEVKKIS